MTMKILKNTQKPKNPPTAVHHLAAVAWAVTLESAGAQKGVLRLFLKDPPLDV